MHPGLPHSGPVSPLDLPPYPFAPAPGPAAFPNRTVHLLGRRLTLMTVPAIVGAIAATIREERRLIVGHYNVHGFNLSMQLPWFHDFLQQADITHCDGMGIIKALGFLGVQLPQHYRVSYSLLMPALLRECDRQGFKLFLLGAKPAALESALTTLRQQYPNASFAGQHGYFDRDDPQDNLRVIQAINTARPHILLVGMGMPLQEAWVSNHQAQLQANAILMGGAIIDRLAGQVSDCPGLISNVGLEWAYRLAKEPRRLGARYVIGNPAFISQILLAKLLGLYDVVDLDEPIAQQAVVAALSQSPSRRAQKRLGEYLVEAGLLTPQHIRQALLHQRDSGQRLGEILVAQGCLQEATVNFMVAHGALEAADQARPPAQQPMTHYAGRHPDSRDPAMGLAPSPTGESSPIDSPRQPMPKRLGEYLVEAGLSTPKHIHQALEQQQHSSQRLGEILVAQGAVRPETVEFLVAYLPSPSAAVSRVPG